MVKRTERGWAAHFICADRCLFRRNTLLERGKKKIIVSTVGNMMLDHKISEVGYDRYSETMVWEAKFENNYWEIDLDKQLDFKSNWCLGKDVDDNKINDMHEKVVTEITKMMEG